MGLIERWASSPQPTDSQAEPSSPSERRVTDPQRVGSILQRLLEGRALISARVPGSDETFLTTLLGVDRREQAFRLDELSPRRGHEIVLIERSLRAASRLEGVEVVFSATVASVADERGIAIYRLPFPHVLHYHQRRSSFRAPVGSGRPVTLRAVHPQAGALVGEVRDLSAGGLAMQVQLPSNFALARGDALSECTVVFPDGRALLCDLEVCHLRREEGSRWTRIGARFLRLHRRDQNLLAQFIVQLERERLKLRPPGQNEGQSGSVR